MKRILVALGIAAALGAAWYFFVPRTAPRPVAPTPTVPAMTPEALREFERWYASQPRFAVPVSKEGALVLIVKFTDYQCPGCAWSHAVYPPVLAKWEARFPGAVRLVEKQYPLNTDCNKEIARSLHPAACEAAVAALLAGDRARGPQMADWLYANQDTMTPAAIRQAAASIGGVHAFDAGMADALAHVTADTQMARMLTVSSTPTFFINGVKMTHTTKVMPPDELDAAIAWEMRKAGEIR